MVERVYVGEIDVGISVVVVCVVDATVVGEVVEVLDGEGEDECVDTDCEFSGVELVVPLVVLLVCIVNTVVVMSVVVSPVDVGDNDNVVKPVVVD